jgi:hypothetical protein
MPQGPARAPRVGCLCGRGGSSMGPKMPPRAFLFATSAWVSARKSRPMPAHWPICFFGSPKRPKYCQAVFLSALCLPTEATTTSCALCFAALGLGADSALLTAKLAKLTELNNYASPAHPLRQWAKAPPHVLCSLLCGPRARGNSALLCETCETCET